jgi:Ni,Fe-hydrogenase III large subunit/Ni,Fe-hydrogenase III component G
MNKVEIKKAIKARLGYSLLGMKEPVPGKFYMEVAPPDLVKAACFLNNDLKSRFLISAATDRRETAGAYTLTHFFSIDPAKVFICLTTKVPEGKEEFESITPFVPAANWAERECQDLIGLKVVGHPDPRRLVLSDDWPADIFPLRKDFPYDTRPPAQQGSEFKFKPGPEGTSTVVVGPFYPVLEEPAQLRLFVEGERIVDCDYRGFYNHRGIEKLGDSVLTYNEIPFVAERICGICGYIHSCCYCETVEEAAGIEVPRRARYIRTLMLEIERIHSHLLWLGIAGHIIGFDTVLMQSWRIREPIMWLCEQITGNRKTYGMNLIGGVRRDIASDLTPKILDVLKKIETETLAVADAIVGDTPLHMRLKDVGRISTDQAREMCVLGPVARASNLPLDSRIDHPYAAYDELPPKVIVHDGGDVQARLFVRVEETFESIRLVREALSKIPGGPIMAEITEELPAGCEGVSVVEAPRGEAIHYVITGPDNRPERWRVRAPTYGNLQALPVMIKDQTIADVPIILGSLDPCFSCTERVETVDVKTGQERIITRNELEEMSRNKRS